MEIKQLTLSNMRARKDYWTPKELSELFKVTPHTVRQWVKRGVLAGQQMEPTSPGSKAMKGRYRVFPQSIEEMEHSLPDIVELSRPFWLRSYAQLLKKRANRVYLL